MPPPMASPTSTAGRSPVWRAAHGVVRGVVSCGASLPEGNDVLAGLLIILAVVGMPQGIANHARNAVTTRRYSLLDNVRRYRL